MARSSILDIAKNYKRNNEQLKLLAAKRKTGSKGSLADFLKKDRRKRGTRAAQKLGEQLEDIAQQKYRRTRGTGVSLDRLLSVIDRKRQFNAIRDKVTIVSLRKNKQGVVLSKSLTYDKSGARVVIRPHKHIVKRIPVEGESPSTPISKAKRISFWCDCEDFAYTWNYSLAVRYGCSEIKNEDINQFPVLKNPGLKLGCCKHGFALLSLIRQKKI